MKKPFTVLFVATVVILCAVPVAQSFKVTRQKTEITILQRRLEETSRQVEQLRSTNERLESERREMRRQMYALRTQSASVEPAPTVTDTAATVEVADERQAQSPSGRGPALRGFLSKMMDDPGMQKFVRDQQRQMLDPLYRPLIQRLGLTKEEADAFKDFLADTQMQGAQHATALFGNSTAERAKAMEEMSAEQKENEQAMREFLGEDRYAQYKDYQETIGERAQLNQFRLQTAGGENVLTDDQTEWLLTLMKEEKQAVAVHMSESLPGAGQDPAKMQAMLSGEGTEQLLQAQATVNRRVYERAAEGLSPEQLEAFGRFQTNQLQMMRMGMNMAKEMFAPEPAEQPSE